MPSETTPKLNLPLIAAQQAQKHLTHNEALRDLDALVQAAVKDRDLSAPPATPAEGDCYIVAAAATGDWAGHEGEIAEFRNGGWVFHASRSGWLVFVRDEGAFLIFDGAAWQDFSATLKALRNLLKLGVNTTADDTNRLAVKSDAVLFSHDDVTPGSGDVRVTVNKKTAADTASVVFQDGASGRAELGLMGSDAFSVKVSVDGSGWISALSIDPATGRLGIGVSSPQQPMHVRGNMRLQDTAGVVEFFNSAGTTRTGYFQAHATAGFYFNMELANPMYFYTSNLLRMTIAADGNVGIGTYAPATRLDVAGPMRPAAYTVATLPSPASIAGAIVYVSDESGGATLAFSDGANWRRVHDRAVVS